MASEALENLNLDVAKNAFTRIRELKYLEFIYQVEERKRKKGDEGNNNLILADFYAFKGNYQEAAKLYKKTGNLLLKILKFLLQSAPQYRPSKYPNTAAHFQVPNKGFVGYIYDSQYRRFPNTAAFSSVPRSAVLRGLTVHNTNSIIHKAISGNYTR